MGVKNLIVTCIILSLSILHNVNSQDCSSDGSLNENGVANEISIDANNRGDIEIYGMSNAVTVKSVVNTIGTDTSKTYIRARIDPDQLVLYADPTFANYEQNEIRTNFLVSVTLTCTTSEKIYNFRFSIIPANNHQPIFDAPSYSIEIPLPLPRNFDLTIFEEIFARDFDLINNQITFTVDGTKLFDTGVKNMGADQKTFFAKLTTKEQILKLDGPETFTLTATDAGVPETKSATVDIVITGDINEVFVEPPTFSQPLFEGNIDSDQNINLNPITFTEETFNTDVVFAIESDFDGDLFGYDDSTPGNNAFVITKKNTLDLKDKDVFRFIVSGTSPGQGKTYATVILSLPLVEEIIVPEFVKPLYTNKLTEDLLLPSGFLISLTTETENTNVVFTLEGDDFDKFDKVDKTVGKEIEIVLKPLDESEIIGVSILQFTVVATYNGKIGRTAVVVQIPPKINVAYEIPKFAKSLYTGQLQEDLTIIMETITIVEPTDEMDFEIVEATTLNIFEIDGTVNDIVFKLKEGVLPEDVNSIPTFTIVISVFLKSDPTVRGTSVIVIDSELTLAPLEIPQFDKTLYTGQLKEDITLSIETIAIVDPTDEMDFEIIEATTLNIFEIDGTVNDIVFKLKEGVLPEDVNSIPTFTIVISVFLKSDPTVRGTSVIVIDSELTLAPLEIPQFDKTLYTGQLKEDITLSIETIAIVDPTDEMDFEIVEATTLNIFEIDGTVNDIVFKLKEGVLPEDVNSIPTFTIVISVFLKSDPTVRGTSVIVIDSELTLAPLEIPQFDKTLYTGQLKEDITLSIDTIAIVDPTDEMDFEIVEATIPNIFEMVGTVNAIVFNLKDGVSEGDVNSVPSFTIVISVFLKSDPTVRGTSVIVIDSELTLAPLEIPQFDKTLYTGQLKEDITLSIDTIAIVDPTDEMDFEIVEATIPNIFEMVGTVNAIVFNLKDGVSEGDVNSVPSFTIVISVFLKSDPTVRGTSVIVIDSELTLAPLEIPQFDKTLYTGQLKEDITLSIDTIAIVDPTDEMDFEIVEATIPNIFEMVGTVNAIEFNLKDGVSEGDVNSVPSFTIVISVFLKSDPTVRGTSVIAINSEFILVPLEIPQFDKSLYSGQLREDLILSMDNIAIVNPTVAMDFKIVEANIPDIFEMVGTVNAIEFNLKDGVSEGDVNSVPSFTIVISVFLKSDPTVRGISVIAINSEFTLVPLEIPQFDKSLYTGHLREDLSLSMDTIAIVGPTAAMKFEIVTATAIDIFEMVGTVNAIEFNLKNGVVEEDVNIAPTFTIVISVYLISDPTVKGISTVIINSDLNTCVPTETDSFPKFDIDVYITDILPTYTGPILPVHAVVPSSPTIAIKYSLLIDDAQLKPKVIIDEVSGMIESIAYISPGVYIITVEARNDIHGLSSFATVRLTVSISLDCGSPQATHALLIREIEEQKEYNTLLDVTVSGTNCDVKIFQTIPNSFDGACQIDGTNFKCDKFNYNDLEFADMKIPQVQIGFSICDPPTKMNLLSNTTDHNKRLKRATSDGRSYALTEDIPFNTNYFYMSLVIIDINDVPPVFVVPATNNILLGYPEPDLASRILPPSLITVNAIGGDSEEFEKIEYSINTNEHFRINAETGEVYPLRYAMLSINEITLTLIAVDDGGNGLPSTPLNIRVRKLQSNHITLLSIEDVLSNDLNDILTHIKDQADLTLQVLHSAVVSYDDVSGLNRGKSLRQFPFIPRTTFRMVVCAFDAEENPIDNDVIKEKLQGLDNVYSISYIPIDEIFGDKNPGNPTNPDENNNDVPIGLIVGISILGVLLLLVSGGAFLLWWFWIRPYEFKNQHSSETNLKDDFHEPLSDPIVTNEFADSAKEITSNGFDVENGVGTGNNHLAQMLNLRLDYDDESRDDSTTSQEVSPVNKDIKANDESSSITPPTQSPLKERRKSIVKFNELVEQIEIPIDAENENATQL